MKSTIDQSVVTDQFQANPESTHCLIEAGLQHHQAGRLVEAENYYRQALAIDSRHVDALHLLGAIAHQVGRYDVAIELIGTAININPTEPRFYSHIALSFKELGRFDEAVAACETAIRLNPEYSEAHYNFGVVLFALKRFQDVVSACEMAISIKPNYVEAHVNLGNALKELGRFERSIAAYKAALNFRPEFIDAHFNLGVVLFDLGQFEQAIEAYSAVIRINPRLNVAHTNLGNALRKLGQLEAAIVAHNTAIRLSPSFAEAHTNLGNVLKELGQFEEAITAHNTALQISPAFAEAYFNLGNVLKEMGRNEDAIAAFDAAIRIKPEFADAHSNRGAALFDLGRFEDALRAFQVGINIRPESADAHYNESFARLLLGDFAIGWKKYEWRWQNPDQKLNLRKFHQPQWDGANFSGRTLLLYAEQGLGDTIQFCRYAALAAAQGGKVILEAPRHLLRVLQDLKGISGLGATGEQLPDFDLQCPLMSLPLIFGTTLETVPASIPYLHAECDLSERWRARLFAATPVERSPKRIGIVWSGNPSFKNDSTRSIDLRILIPLLEKSGYQFFALQKDVRISDAPILENLPNLVDLSAALNDFAETAAIIANLDLVLTVDTAVAHLAGALGKPVWIMLPFVPDFRWLLGRSDSPWYPSVRLFRQPAIGNWDSVIAEIQAALDAQFG